MAQRRGLWTRIKGRATATVLRVVPAPEDPPRRWRGIDDPELAPLRVLRYGDCCWRENPHGHGRGTRPGYPLVAAEELAARGVGMRFCDVWVGGTDALPQDREELVRHVHLDGDPDVVLVQTDMAHATRAVLPTGPAWVRLRDLAPRRPAALVWPAYALQDPFLRRLGSHVAPYPGDGRERLERFFELVRATWPAARIVVVGLTCTPFRPGYADHEAATRSYAVTRAVAEAQGVELVEPRAAVDELRARLGARAVHGANGLDLRRPAHELIGRMLAERLLAGERSPAAAR